MSTPTMPRRPRAAAGPDLIDGERYLSVGEVADRLGTTVRFPRRLIEERRIEFVKIGRHVRIPESVLAAYIKTCTVQPINAAPHLRSVAG